MQAKTVMGGCYVSLSSVAAPALPNSLTSLTPTNNTCNNKSTDTRFRRHSFDKRGYKTITSVRIYKNHITGTLALDHLGNNDETVDAFQLKLNSEIKKPVKEQRFPLYKAVVDNISYYIIPLRGSGLWDAIWGYIALKSDINTIKGAVFDHKAETAGLGAEITQKWFMDRFKDEKVFNSSGQLVGINVSKTNNDPKNMDKNDHEVDAISGATITGDGVTDMIIERLTHYLPYFEKEKTTIASLN